MLEFLPENVKNAIRHINSQYLYEIRLRAGHGVCVNWKGKYSYLGAFGLTENSDKAIRVEQEDIFDCVLMAGNHSVYSVEEEIKRGFITAENGERIGLAGEYVYERGQPLTIRNFSSLCIRVPHEIHGCGAEIFEICMKDRIPNVLICSPAGQGKTTILRDICRLISKNYQKNVLICDERGEISNGDLGDFCDVLKYADKSVAFEVGLRAMRPDVIITDELSRRDFETLQLIIAAGVNVVSSAHFHDFKVITQPYLEIFDYFAVLDGKEIGKIKGIYDKKGEKIC